GSDAFGGVVVSGEANGGRNRMPIRVNSIRLRPPFRKDSGSARPGAGRDQSRTDDLGSGDSGPDASTASTPASGASAPASGTSGSDICASASGSSKLRTERRKPRVITAR